MIKTLNRTGMTLHDIRSTRNIYVQCVLSAHQASRSGALDIREQKRSRGSLEVFYILHQHPTNPFALRNTRFP